MSKKNVCIIVVYPDQSLQFFNWEIGQDNFQKGSRFFRAPDNLWLVELGEWIGNKYNHPKIKEITKLRKGGK